MSPASAAVRAVSADAAARPEGKPRLDWLDGLRAYAIAGVVAVHASVLAFQKQATWTDGLTFTVTGLGRYGVQLFFVISAMTAYYTLGRHRPSARGFGAWLTKRYLRIAPLYYLAIPLYFGVLQGMNWGRMHAGRAPLPVFGARDALFNVLLIHSWTVHGNNNVVPGGWSIGVEVMFYVLAPLCFLIYRRHAVVCLLSYAAIAVLCLWGTHVRAGGPVENGSFLYYWFPAQFPAILCGLALCRLTDRWMYTHAPAPRRAVLLAAMLLLPLAAVTYVCGIGGNSHNLLTPTLAALVSCCLVVLARGPWQRAFANNWAVWLGRISYSMYIVHFVVLEAITAMEARTHLLARLPEKTAWLLVFATVLAVSSGIAMLTKRLIEDPGIRFGHILAARIERKQRA